MDRRLLPRTSCVICGHPCKRKDSLSTGSVICSLECSNIHKEQARIKYKQTIGKRHKCRICSNTMDKDLSRMKSLMICSDECKQVHESRKSYDNNVLKIQHWTSKGYTHEEAALQISQIQRARSPRCLEHWLAKGYNEEAAKHKVSEYQNQFGKIRASESIQVKRERSPRCIEFWLKRGLSKADAEEALVQFQSNTSLKAFKTRYGDQGERLYKEYWADQNHKRTLSYLIEQHGEIQGQELWAARYSNIGYSSKIACDFFEKVVEILPEEIKRLNIYYRNHQTKEFGINWEGKWYQYDFVIPSIKLCIEFNGAFWHADPTIYKSGDHIKIGDQLFLVDDIWNRDRTKLNAISSHGYHVEVIWCNSKKIPVDKLRHCVELVKQRYKEYQNENSHSSQ
jgi:G:T-mismatch repair DNA endonuclease (very short patch repair protein)